MFKYSVDKTVVGYECSIPYRKVITTAQSEQEAVGKMMGVIADLAYNGSLDPSDPERMGCQPLQHSMNVLADQLLWHLDRRQRMIEDVIEGSDKPEVDPEVPGLTKVNEIIAGLGTAISSLARIKTL